MNPKVLVVIVVLLVALLAVGVGMGATRQQEPVSGEPPPLVERLGKLFVKEQPIKVGDVLAGSPSACRGQLDQGEFAILEGSACTLVIGSSSEQARVLALELVQGREVGITLDPNGDKGLKSEQTLDTTDREVTLRFFEEGGVLEIACRDGGTEGTCRLTTR